MNKARLSEVIEAGFPGAISALVIVTPANDNHEGFRIEVELADLELKGTNLDLVEARVINAVKKAKELIEKRKAEEANKKL
jgi:hypothetical protein